MSIITTTGRAALAQALKDTPLYVAWGRGRPDWDNELPRESRSAIALTHEVGRRLIASANYCRPDEAGEIVMRGARFTQSQTPTPHLHLRCEFDFDDGLGETIRELGIFSGTVLKPSVPRGKRYVTPNELQQPGILLTLDHLTPIVRGVASRISFDLVITF